jgi:hypothetical protein
MWYREVFRVVEKTLQLYVVSDYTSFVWSLKSNVYVIVQVISSINIIHGLLHLNRNIVQYSTCH